MYYYYYYVIVGISNMSVQVSSIVKCHRFLRSMASDVCISEDQCILLKNYYTNIIMHYIFGIMTHCFQDHDDLRSIYRQYISALGNN